ncbi:sodium-dependent transporter [Halorubellus sp. JP-L1]|uniref:sodium-dependent transporter n=1 Tax=Halorubellus sp. JP-L1 TaxID=2715753 RepID=UPI00140E3D8E|nr:sodium-dependent transporter [Halorubellus sp. JP-L1]NHN41029.1 sodium-dependent transporter [Halorubellus sp. JP-L1]
MAERETWSSRVGFILAAVGSAVGLGNIWQFPFQAANNGGAAFLVVYLAAVFLIGFPALLAEFVVGRNTEKNPVDAFREYAGGSWGVVGGAGVFVAFWILSFYSVVGGWVLRYAGGSLTGAYFGDPSAYFDSIAVGPGALALHFVFMALVVGIVALGVEDGIELGTKVMVPSIVVILVALAAWASTLPGVADGYAYYLDPDLGTLAANLPDVLPNAVGQAFFTLSLGMGAMVTYASYLGDDDSLPADGAIIVVLNTVVGVLAGLVVFPVLAAEGIGFDTAGTGAVFESMAAAFATLPAGGVLGLLFFLVLLLAALSSAISLLEVVVAYVVENTSRDRKPVATVLGAGIFLLGAPTAWGFSFNGVGALDWYNVLAYNLFLPLVGLGVAVVVGWTQGARSTRELARGSGGSETLGLAWLWALRTVVVLALTVTLVLGVKTILVTAGVLDPAVLSSMPVVVALAVAIAVVLVGGARRVAGHGV